MPNRKKRNDLSVKNFDMSLEIERDSYRYKNNGEFCQKSRNFVLFYFWFGFFFIYLFGALVRLSKKIYNVRRNRTGAIVENFSSRLITLGKERVFYLFLIFRPWVALAVRDSSKTISMEPNSDESFNCLRELRFPSDASKGWERERERAKVQRCYLQVSSFIAIPMLAPIALNIVYFYLLLRRWNAK